MDRPIIANVFGVLGAVAWSVQLLPQIFLNYRRGSTSGLSAGFMLFWAWAGIPMGAYNIVSKFNYALWVQPQILTSLSLITWAQCYYYERKWSFVKVGSVISIAACFMGGIEAALILALRIGRDNGTEWPLMLMAILAGVLLACGVLEQYLAIFKSKSVHGVSFLFCGLDALGDLTSIISVIFEPELEIVALVMYGLEFVLWCGVFACGFYYKLLPWLRRLTSDLRIAEEGSETRYTTAFDAGIALQDLPSSISVFRTAARDGLRSRHDYSVENQS